MGGEKQLKWSFLSRPGFKPTPCLIIYCFLTFRLTRVMDLSQAVDEKKNATLACRAGDLSVDISLYDDHMEAGKLLEVC